MNKQGANMAQGLVTLVPQIFLAWQNSTHTEVRALANLNQSCGNLQDPPFVSQLATKIRQPTDKMSESQVTLRTRKFIRNPLLARKQMVV